MREVYWPAEWRLASQGHSFYLLIPHRTARATTVDVKKTLQITNPETFVSNPRSHISSRVWLLHNIALLSPRECRNRMSILRQLSRNSSTHLQLVKWNVTSLCTLITHVISYMPKKTYFVLTTEFDISKFGDVSQIKRTTAHFTLNSLTALEVSSVRTYGEPLLLERFVVWSYSSIILFVTDSAVELKSTLG